MNKTILILGGDGYLGWSLGLYRAFSTDDRVILVDSYLKRDLQKSLGIKELFEFPFLPERIRTYTTKTGKRNLSSLSIDATNYEAISEVISRYKPDVIVNAAHQPSAPLSMKSPHFSALTITNNEKSCLNVLWAVSKNCPDSLIINLGSAGVYQSIDSSFIPETKKTLHFLNDDVQHSVQNAWLPMQASDFYHQSKVQTFGITEMCLEAWSLKVITVQQSTIFGQCVLEKQLDDPNLFTRFNYDDVFGTVLNRFVCQAVKGFPLTVYGDGQSQTNIICLCDVLKGMSDLMNMEMTPGSHKVINHFAKTMSIKTIAEMVVKVYGYGDILNIENPRIEKNCSRVKKFENCSTNQSDDITTSIANTLDFARRFSYNIDVRQFVPTIKWRG